MIDQLYKENTMEAFINKENTMEAFKECVDLMHWNGVKSKIH